MCSPSQPRSHGVCMCVCVCVCARVCVRMCATHGHMCARRPVYILQVYGGVVYMDFDEQYMAGSGGVGRYSRLDPALLPPLHLMYSSHPKESGKVCVLWALWGVFHSSSATWSRAVCAVTHAHV